MKMGHFYLNLASNFLAQVFVVFYQKESVLYLSFR